MTYTKKSARYLNTMRTTPKRKPKSEQESTLQTQTAQWLSMQYPPEKYLYFHPPNGGKRDAITGAILKRQGVRRGVSDWIFLEPRNGASGLIVELKTETGSMTAEQKEFLKMALQRGYVYAICRTLDNFIEIVNLYFGVK
jgi:hypothetical protein